MRMLCRNGTAIVGDVNLAAELLQIRDDLRRARDAESAHLEASLKIQGAKSLRLQQLSDILRERGFANAADLELKTIAGEEPQLWLSLSHCVVMQPDASTYQLSLHGQNQIETLLETKSLSDTVASCVRVMAHAEVLAARNTAVVEASPLWNQATLVYVWMTGVVTGVAALTLYAILLKKLLF
jgi:hypothetical protein